MNRNYSKKRPYQLEIFGSVIQLRAIPKKETSPCPIKLKRIVSPEFVQLWYKLKNNEFDKSLWGSLSCDQRTLLGKVARDCHVKNDDLNIALSETFRRSHDRLKLLEGNIKAGNMNKDLVNEYIGILKELETSGQMNSHSAGALTAKIKRTYESLLSNIEDSK